MNQKIVETEKFYIAEVSIDSIKPNPRNAEIFDRDFEVDDVMVQSILEEDVIEMPILSQDLYIVSGHRRIAAAKAAGKKNILCKIFKDTHDNLVVKFIHANLLKKPESPQSLLKAAGILEKYRSLNPYLFVPSQPRNQNNGKKNDEKNDTSNEEIKLRKIIEGLHEELKEARMRIKLLTEELENMHSQSELDIYKEKLDNFEEKIIEKEEEIRELKARILDKERQIAALEETISQLQKKQNTSSNLSISAKKEKAVMEFYARRDVVLTSLRNIKADTIPHTLLEDLKKFISEVEKEVRRIIQETKIEKIASA